MAIINQEKMAVMAAKISLKIKECQAEMTELQNLAQRLSFVGAADPVDQFGDAIPLTEIEKQYTKTVSQFDKKFPAAKP